MRQFEENDDIGRGGLKAGFRALMLGFHYAFVVLAIFITGTVLWYFTFWGYYTVNPQEAVIVLRFGKIVDVHKDGWHWNFPYPINRIVRVPASAQTIVLKAFWPNPNKQAASPESIETYAQPLMPGRDGSLLTGDANIIHTEWELVYQISDPLKYYTSLMCPANPMGDDDIIIGEKGKDLGRRGPKTLIRALLENAVIKVTAVQKVEDPLYKNSNDYQLAVEEELSRSLEAYDVGVTVKSAVLKAKTPPFSTVGAFHDVINAEQQSAKEKLNARKHEVDMKNLADKEASRIKVEAEVYRQRVVSEIESESIYFKKTLEKYKESRESVIIPLYTDTVTSFLKDMKDKYIIPQGTGKEKQELRIMINPEPAYVKEEKK